MEQKSTSVWKSAITYGVLFAIVSILVSVIFYATGHPFAKSAQWVGIIITVAAVILIQLNYRKNLGGYMSYGQALVIAILSVFFASVITGIYNYVLMNFIDPSLQEQLRIITEQKILEQGVPEAQVENALNVAMKFQKPGIQFVMGLFISAFMGLIIGLITSTFTKKDQPDKVLE